MNKDLIPKGDYCYTVVKSTSNVLNISTCPYWGISMEHEDQNNGYCKYLNTSDWDKDSLSLLWDQVKECDINL